MFGGATRSEVGATAVHEEGSTTMRGVQLSTCLIPLLSVVLCACASEDHAAAPRAEAHPAPAARGAETPPVPTQALVAAPPEKKDTLLAQPEPPSTATTLSPPAPKGAEAPPGAAIKTPKPAIETEMGKELDAKDGGKPAAATEEETAADQKAKAYKDDNVARGDYYFKTGYYLKASRSYRQAVLDDMENPWKKLAFGHSLLAIGNYTYSSYALRRALSQLDATKPFDPDAQSLFPSKAAFNRALMDLKRYVTYSPRDPSGLTVLGYVFYARGEDARAREIFGYLQRLPENEKDAFAEFLLKQLDRREGERKDQKPDAASSGDPKGAGPEDVAPVSTR
jgi:Tfp pilus assembly protein PilF